MPEPVKSRPTRAHENLFLFAASDSYLYDFEAVKVPTPRQTSGNLNRHCNDGTRGRADHLGASIPWKNDGSGRNRRTVWKIPHKPLAAAHFAVMPCELAEPCVLAGSPRGGTVLDPFSGAGTTGLVATRLGRSFIGVELNPEYCTLARTRIMEDSPLFNR